MLERRTYVLGVHPTTQGLVDEKDVATLTK